MLAACNARRRYRSHPMAKPRQCPVCGSGKVAPAIYGPLDDPELVEAHMRGRAFLAGEVLPPPGERPYWGCSECGQTWDIARDHGRAKGLSG
jgi:hypothetical protein